MAQREYEPMPERLAAVIHEAATTLCAELGAIVRGAEILSFDDAYARIASAQTECLTRLASTELWGRDNQLPSGQFWKQAGWVAGCGPLQRHAREKPHGYAGDFEMLERISATQLSPGAVPAAFDQFFQDQAAPRAVRNRTKLNAGRIVTAARQGARNRPVKIVSVGSGPAADVRRAVAELAKPELQRLKISLLDIDPHALEFALAHLQGAIPAGGLAAHRVNLFRISRQPHVAQLLEGADLIICAGLLDYLTQPDAAALLQVCWSGLRHEGKLLAFNFSPANPSRAYMEWFGNWYLTYRTPDQMHALGRSAGWQDRQFVVGAEDEAINLYIEATKGH